MTVAWILTTVFVVLVAILHVHNFRTVQRLTVDNGNLKRSMLYFVGHTWVNEEGELLRVVAKQLPDKSYQVTVQYSPAEPAEDE